MKTRSRSTVAILALALLTTVRPVVAQERVDLIILLDSSRSMLGYYNQVIDFVVSDAIREYLRFGDGFHLMNFADTTQLEIAQVLRTEEDVRRILSRLYLMYPLGRNTDLITALRGVSQYASRLGTASSKYIILITDGMHSPSRDSNFASYSSEEVRAEMERSASRIRENGWTMRIVQVPFNGAVRTGLDGIESRTADGSPAGTDLAPGAGTAAQPTVRSDEYEALSDAPGTGDYLTDIAATLGTGIAAFDPDNTESTIAGMVDILQITYPATVKARSRSFKLRFAITNPRTRQIPVEFDGLLLPDGSNILASRALAVLSAGESINLECTIALPASFPEGPGSLILEPRLANDVRVSPAKGTIAVELRISAFAGIFRHSASFLIFIIAVVAALAVLIFVIRYIRTVHRRAEEPVLQAFMGASEARDDQEVERKVSHALPGSRATGISSAPRAGRPIVAGMDHEARNAALLASAAPGTSSLHTEKRNQTILDSASSSRLADDRSRLLDQWSPGDRARYVLPLKSSVQKDAATDAGNAAAYAYQPKVTKPGTLRVELRVRNQNPYIGSRNIKTLHAGRQKTIGGKNSDFLVFLLPVPKRIADIHYDGQSITIVPVRPAFFPDYTGPIQIELGEDIRIVNNRGKELFMSFQRYVPPLEKLNRLLHCIEVPGISPATE
jgi:hypothetical protein